MLQNKVQPTGRIRVTTADEQTTYFDGKFNIGQQGVLVVQDEAGSTHYFSPNFWRHVEDSSTKSKG